MSRQSVRGLLNLLDSLPGNVQGDFLDLTSIYGRPAGDVRNEEARERFFGEPRGRLIWYILAAVPWTIGQRSDRLVAL